MRPLRIAIAAVVLAATGAVLAQEGNNDALCVDTTGQDKQADFKADAGVYKSVDIIPGSPPKLRLNTNRNKLDPELIILPFEQELEALTVDDQAGNGASHTLGWFYYDDLIARGFIDRPDGGGGDAGSKLDKLADRNGNGIADFHEALFNLSPTAGAYIGSQGPRCPSRYFYHPGPDGGLQQFREPDLLTGDCGSASSYRDAGGPSRWENLAGYPAKPGGARVGQAVEDTDLDTPFDTPAFVKTDSYFSDRGMFPHIPNLLEPPDALNDYKGIGRIVFFATDDDNGTCPSAATPECLSPRMAWTNTSPPTQYGPIWDKSNTVDGIPDYKASAFDTNGRIRPGRDAGAAISEEDRRVRIGTIQGEREVVFFLMTYVPQTFDGTDSCFMVTEPYNDAGNVQCKLWVRGDLNVFFSKSQLNLDVHQIQGNATVTTKELKSGWLSSGATTRLNTPNYGNVRFPNNQYQDVKAINGRAAHTLVGAPSNNPLVWILGWEDQNAGGNRTYNDIVILINKQNNGAFQSDVVSTIDVNVAQDFTITEVTFQIVDQPYYVADGGSAACTTGDGGYASRPHITYQMALDCKVCTANCSTETPTYTANANPTWLTLPFSEPTNTNPGTRDQTLQIADLLERGYTGSQLCWRAVLESPGEGCQPTISNVNISYKAQRSGEYVRATPVAVGNGQVYGRYETPGRTWFVDGGSLYPSNRIFDDRLDTIDRGHFNFTQLFDPDDINTQYANHAPEWDTGEQLRLAALGNPDNRKLVTWDPAQRKGVAVSSFFTADAGVNTPVFPDTLCGIESAGTYYYDLNQRDGCNSQDRAVLKNWLYGWEYKDSTTTPTTQRRRTWPMGGVYLSSPAVVGAPGVPDWMLKSSGVELQRFKQRFQQASGIQGRDTVAFVGTTQGYLHGVRAGKLVGGNDTCTSYLEPKGYFDRSGTNCTGARQYGNGEELFAYLPGRLLPYYVENFRRAAIKPTDTADYKKRAERRAMVDGSPATGPVDLGDGTYNLRTGYVPESNREWMPDDDPTKGAKTVLASPTGPRESVFFALDITKPSSPSYPIPLWELDLKEDLFRSNSGANGGEHCLSAGGDCRTLEELFSGVTYKADTSSSRHNPLLLRMDFGTAGRKWVAAFATDFAPRAGAVGTLYLIDVKSGLPVQVPGSGTKANLAGIITLGDESSDVGEGIGGPPGAVDVNGDGAFDVIYVPSTSGKIYRVNLSDIDTSRALGKVISTCVVANARNVLTTPVLPNLPSQRIFSSIGIKKEPSPSGAVVHLYFATGNSPDISNEPDDLANPKPRYNVFAFDDTYPLDKTCSATTPRTPAWVTPLGAGEQVWGGIAVTDTGIATATAAGTSAAVCSLDTTKHGSLYVINYTGGIEQTIELSGHALGAPAAIGISGIGLTDNKGNRVLIGNPEGKNTGTGHAPGVLIWDVQKVNDINKVVP